MKKAIKKQITIVYRFLPHYRYKFFQELYKALKKKGINLNLIYGKNKNPARQNEIDIDWAVSVKNIEIKIRNSMFLWVPVPAKTVFNSDLIVLMQENKILSNYPLFLGAKLKRKKLALWGHGLNHQAYPNSLGNRFKRLYSTNVNWWFAYTKGVASKVEAMGFPKDRISIIQNSIDTEKLIKEYDNCAREDVWKLRKAMSINDGPVGLFCGGMIPGKRLGFIISACKQIKKKLPCFQTIFIGAGEESQKVEREAAINNWIHFVGPKLGKERVKFFKIADVLLMPGMVGLAILDSFAMKTVLITTDHSWHGPEIEYLENYWNGLMVPNTLESYSEAVVEVLSNKKMMADLKQHCRESALKYTIEQMVNNFVEGVLQCLEIK
ncbi:MAG: glycosyltransferase family 4 protein [Promethearchaeota archaeon]